MRFLIAAFLILVACKKKETSTSVSDSMAQQIGDAMASIDEAGLSDGAYAIMKREHKIIARL